MQKCGRKPTNILYSAVAAIGGIVIALSGGIAVMSVCRSIQGLSFVGLHLSCLMVAEYTHPKRRGFFITFKMLAVCLGELISHGLSAVLTWRHISWIGVVPAALSGIRTFTWKESPAWFAYKGRYDECTAAFERLLGNESEART